VRAGDFAGAVPRLERALPAAPTHERPVLQANLARALFVTGDFFRAEAVGRDMLDDGTRMPEVLAIVARSRVALRRIDDETAALLDEAEGLAPSPDARLMIDLARIEAALATGRRPGEIPEGADSRQAWLRAWIHLVRGALRADRRDREAAVESFRRAVKEGGETMAAQIAGERLDALAPERKA